MTVTPDIFTIIHRVQPFIQLAVEILSSGVT